MPVIKREVFKLLIGFINASYSRHCTKFKIHIVVVMCVVLCWRFLFQVIPDPESKVQNPQDTLSFDNEKIKKAENTRNERTGRSGERKTPKNPNSAMKFEVWSLQCDTDNGVREFLLLLLLVSLDDPENNRLRKKLPSIS